MMNALERETGFPLLVRDRSGVRLTAAGERLLPAIRELVQAAGHLEGQIAEQAGRRRESIRVAAYSSICMHWLPTIGQEDAHDVQVEAQGGHEKFLPRKLRHGEPVPVPRRVVRGQNGQQGYPDVSIDIRMGSVEEIYRWLQEGTVDLSFASRQDQWRYDWTPLWDDPLLAILPPDYPAGDRDWFPVAEFAGKEFLMPSLGFAAVRRTPDRSRIRRGKPVSRSRAFIMWVRPDWVISSCRAARVKLPDSTDCIPLTSDHSIYELEPMDRWIGKSLKAGCPGRCCRPGRRSRRQSSPR